MPGITRIDLLFLWVLGSFSETHVTAVKTLDRGFLGRGGKKSSHLYIAFRNPRFHVILKDYEVFLMDRGTWTAIRMMVPLFIMTACGGGSPDTFGTSGTSTAPSSITLTWNANHEKSVNAPGGGYYVYYANAPGVNTQTANMIQVPYVSGALAPTSVSLTNPSSGTYYFRVVAYSSFNPPNGSTTRRSSDSAEVSIQYP